MSTIQAPPPPRSRAWIVAAAVAVVLAGGVAWEIIATRPVRQALTSYTALIAAANRQDIAAIGPLCTQRYLQTHRPGPAREGGVIGLPRNIHTNFQAWRHGPHVWICPTNRVGPLYQFVLEAGAWRFDGPVGFLRGRGQVIPLADLADDAMPLGDDETVTAPP